MKKSVGIIGGGASGCFAALVLKKIHNNIDVTIYEQNDRVLKKLLLTGNGRCNLSNLSFDAYKNYNNPSFVKSVLERFSARDTLSFFEEELFIKTATVGDLVYPYSFQANSVVSALLNNLKMFDVKIVCNSKISDLRKLNHDYVIIAVGSNAGGGQSTFDIFDGLGLEYKREKACLCPIMCNGEDISGLNGIRAKVAVRIGDNVSDGEILFKQNYLSGIVIFQASSAYEGQDYLSVDFMPQYSEDEVNRILEDRKKVYVQDDLVGLFAKNIGQAIIKRGNIAQNIKNYKIRITGLDSMKNSQVARGGLSLSEIDGDMEIRKLKRNYAIGEAVDVNGLCGGYNLQWAWSSGFLAASKIAKEIEDDKDI